MKFGKSLLACLLVLTLILTTLTVGLAESPITFSGGSGTEQDPYLITTEAQLNAIRENPNACYALAADIILTDSWTPVGTEETPFAGTLDGREYIISCLDIGSGPDGTDGMFGVLTGTVKNLMLEKVNFETSVFQVTAGAVAGENNGIIDHVSVAGTLQLSTTSRFDKKLGEDNSSIAGIAGINNGTIQNCRNTAAVTATACDSTYVVAAGIVGTNYGTITGCMNQGAVSATATSDPSNMYCGNTNAAGIVYDDEEGTVTLCANTGEVTSTFVAGGIADVAYADLSKCYNTGSISGGMDVAGICGVLYLAQISDCYNAGAITGTSGEYEGIAGIASETYGTLMTCYNAGAITKGTQTNTDTELFTAGPITAYLESTTDTEELQGSVQNCYFLDSTCATNPYGIATELSNEQMKSQSSFVNYDYSGIWTMGSDDYLYPVFQINIAALSAHNSTLRLYGDTRYETSLAVADYLKQLYGTSQFDTVILAYGSDFADALSGSYLASVKKAPILLIDSVGTSDAARNSVSMVLNYLKKSLNPGGTVYLLGGETVMSTSLESTLAQTYTTKRLSGPSRIETNLEVLKEVGIPAGQDLLVADGTGFADALSAASSGKPILLLDTINEKLTDGQKTYLKSLKVGSLYCLGGTNVVADSFETQLLDVLPDKAFSRLSGADRYETSICIADTFFESDVNTITLAWGGNYPDGLCLGPVAAYLGAPIVLTQEYSETADNPARNYATALHTRYSVLAVGGSGQSSQKQLTDSAIQDILKGPVQVEKYSGIRL